MKKSLTDRDQLQEGLQICLEIVKEAKNAFEWTLSTRRNLWGEVQTTA